MESKELAQRLRGARAYASMDRKVLAALLNVSEAKLGRWERGEIEIPELARREVARITGEACGVDLSAFGMKEAA